MTNFKPFLLRLYHIMKDSLTKVNYPKKSLFLILFIVAFIRLYAQPTFETLPSSLMLQIGELEHVIDVEQQSNNSFIITFAQPLDHDNVAGVSFTQRIYLTHVGFDQPMVMVTEGYAAPRNRLYEISNLLTANQLIVEHRYFGVSTPKTKDWQHLTTRQAATDHHRIIESFKKLYTEKWLTTGISKGGQTAIYHRYYYPDDVDVTVPYVAPLNFEVEDPRLTKFLNSVGSASCRKKIFEYQRRLLERREALLPLMKWYCLGKEQKFTIGREAAFEYAVLEYPFSFWQWGKDCRDIPTATASNDEMLQHLIDVVGFNLYSDRGVAYYHPFFYQAMTELGYYGFDTTGLRHLLKAVPQPSNAIFAPMSNLAFDAKLNQDVRKWLRKSGNKMLYIYGELDAWSGAAVNPSGKTDALKIVMKNRAHHDARIKNMTSADKQKTIETLNRWLADESPKAKKVLSNE